MEASNGSPTSHFTSIPAGKTNSASELAYSKFTISTKDEIFQTHDFCLITPIQTNEVFITDFDGRIIAAKSSTLKILRIAERTGVLGVPMGGLMQLSPI